MAIEWFRKKGWSPKRREEFFTRLRRCRDKSEYVRVQALELKDAGSRNSHLGAIELFDYFLQEWPDDYFVSTVYDGKAEAFVHLGDLERAVEAYREVFRVQREERVCDCGSSQAFGWLVATTPLPKLYTQALSVLAEFPRDTFPIERYRAHTIQALICAARHKPAKAREHARAALAEAAIKSSGIRYHPTFGVVQTPNQKVYERLQELAA